MKYFSLNGQSPVIDFKEASIQGQAPDKGLYFPETLPSIEADLVKNIERLSNEEIAFRVIKPYVGECIPGEDLFELVKETINFPMPLVQVEKNIFSLELFHGNTLAFKDIGARFMSRCLGYFVKGNTRRVTVLVATSGDTGGAVADGFFDVEGVDVIILYPSGKVSKVQEQQLTTLGKNIHAIEVNGTFDDCQSLVKHAFLDDELHERSMLTSANSINVARWLPQQFFYFFAYKQWQDKSSGPMISVPSGNFGNICAGLLAMRTGLPISHFVAACNANDVIPSYFQNGTYEAKKSVATISNAMDVGDPSNFSRIIKLFDGEFNGLKKVLTALSITDEETRQTMKKVYADHGYLLDPHGAVGYAALKTYLSSAHQTSGIFLETAHPVKFYDVVEPLLNIEIPLPEAVKKISNKQKQAEQIGVDYNKLKEAIVAIQSLKK